MGFGKKTDYPTGRVLDLDKSYRYIIKPAAEAAGYECVRADEIQHAGNINVPMYEQLLGADVVIADVSTYNPNAFYELGVRHALKPYTTITIAEDKLVFPFDIGQIAIRKYHHLGEGIDFGEVERMRDELRDAIQIVGTQAACDSPVYTFLHGLHPPALAKEEVQRAVASVGPIGEALSQPTIRTLMDQADAAFGKSDFITAKSFLSVVRSLRPTDTYVLQRLALATYKSKLPTVEAALNEAVDILAVLEPPTSTDSETLGLYGAVYKRLWDVTTAKPHLDKAIWAHEKGFYVKNDYYNGINLAFLLNVRAALRAENQAEAIADFVIAQRTRRRVLALCQELLDATPSPKGSDLYWIRATMAEAYLGLGDTTSAQQILNIAKGQPDVASWMIQSTDEQLSKLESLLAKSPLGGFASGAIA
jgi:hypothetical protein